MATSLPSFHRVVSALQSKSGRLRIAQCAKSKVPLHGKDGHVGVQECHDLYKELERLKRRGENAYCECMRSDEHRRLCAFCSGNVLRRQVGSRMRCDTCSAQRYHVRSFLHLMLQTGQQGYVHFTLADKHQVCNG